MKKNILLTSIIFLSTCAVCLAIDTNTILQIKQQAMDAARAQHQTYMEAAQIQPTTLEASTASKITQDTQYSPLASGATKLNILNKTSDPITVEVALMKLPITGGCYATSSSTSITIHAPTTVLPAEETWYPEVYKTSRCAYCCAAQTRATISSDNWSSKVTFDFSKDKGNNYDNFDQPPTIQKKDSSTWSIKISASYDDLIQAYTLTVEEVKL